MHTRKLPQRLYRQAKNRSDCVINSVDNLNLEHAIPSDVNLSNSMLKLSMTNSSPKSWSVIKFPDEDAVSVVPTSWLQEDGKCFWPPYDQKLLRLAIERNQPPDPNWKTYPYVGFQNNVYDNFKEANKKSYVATNYSDLDSHSETVYTFSSKKRKIFKKSYSFSSTEEEDITLQPPPALKRRNEKTVEFPQTIGRVQGEIGVQHVKNKHQSCSYNSDSEDEVRTSMSFQMMSPSTYKKHPGKSLESRSGGHVTASTSLNRSSPDFAQQNKEVPRTNLPICSTKNNYLQLKSSGQPPDDTIQSNDATKIMNYLQHIIRKVNILQSIMVDMSSQLNDLQTKSNNNDVEGIENTSNSIFVVLDYLPVNSLIDMDRFESFLSNDEQMRNAKSVRCRATLPGADFAAAPTASISQQGIRSSGCALGPDYDTGDQMRPRTPQWIRPTAEGRAAAWAANVTGVASPQRSGNRARPLSRRARVDDYVVRGSKRLPHHLRNAPFPAPSGLTARPKARWRRDPSRPVPRPTSCAHSWVIGEGKTSCALVLRSPSGGWIPRW
ncbi:hypothetical protein FQR65_LT19119 [Abscondita terminalis]|nr:hypothetical protein FQR65_LT19119 [Abscondita terminalis]